MSCASGTPALAILAGGASRRMGRDKASIVLDGRTLLARAVAAGVEAGLDVFVVGRARSEVVDGVSGWIVDDRPGDGPLAALATALGALERELLLVACDMPLLDADAIAWLAMLGAPDDVDAVMTITDRVEPLFARYRPSARAAAARLVDAGERSLRALIDECRVHVVPAPPEIASRLVNVNEPGDLERLMPTLADRGASSSAPAPSPSSPSADRSRN